MKNKIFSLLISVMTFIIVIPTVYASPEILLKVDPHSQISIESHFPEAIESTVVFNDKSIRQFKKNPGPLKKSIKVIKYEVLVPFLIELIQSQQKEINELKDAQKAKTK